MLQYGVQGIMIGRGSIGYPWIFREIKAYLERGELIDPPTMSERVDVCRRHLLMSVDWKGEFTGIREMRRHYNNYFKGIPDFKPYRMKMVTSDESKDVFAALDEVLDKFADHQFV